jgi:hypothetical protein
MHRWNTAQFRIDLRNKRTELQLFGELPCVEIANRTRLNFRRINLRVVDRLFAGSMMMCRIVFPSFFRLRLKSVRPPPRM